MLPCPAGREPGTECYQVFTDEQGKFIPPWPDLTVCPTENADFNLDPTAGVVNAVYYIDCDDQAEALDVTNSGIIVGISYKASAPDFKRPVYWAKVESKYFAFDLGLPLTAEKSLALDIDDTARYHAEGIKLKLDKFADGTGLSVLGHIVTDVVGETKIYTPHLWFNLSVGGHVGPFALPISSNQKIISIDSGVPVGYETINSSEQANAMLNLGEPKYDKEKPPLFQYMEGWEFTKLLTQYEGNSRLNAISSAGAIGATMIGSAPNSAGIQTASYLTLAVPAFYNQQCYQEDLNDLLTGSSKPNLTEALLVGGPTFSNTVLAKDDLGTYYFLNPVDPFRDIGVKINIDKKGLLAEENNRYTIQITNHSSEYATCVKFSVKDYVYFPEDHYRSLKQEPGGVTHKNVIAEGMQCDTSYIETRCTLTKLEANETRTVVMEVEPRPVLVDRTVRTRVQVTAREERPTFYSDIREMFDEDRNNVAEAYTQVHRDKCFIATAAYGSLGHRFVEDLRGFRDSVLLQSAAGAWFVDLYYRVSPPIADIVKSSEILRVAVRISLTPIVMVIRHSWLLHVMAVCLLMSFILLTASWNRNVAPLPPARY
ncbi:MAG: hypothetical protein OEX00_06975 [Gammaproteobacteria bacterium]|nr:hypothetical protein [Gammaproteobacteria bacterium]